MWDLSDYSQELVPNDEGRSISSEYQSVWSIGEHCRAEWSGNGKYYDGVIRKFRRLEAGKVLALVKFLSYDSDDSEEVDIQTLQKIKCAGSKSKEEGLKADQGQSSQCEAKRGLFFPLRGDENQIWLQEKYGHEVDSDNEASQPSCSTVGQASDWINSSPDKLQTVCKRNQRRTAFGGSPKKKSLQRNKTEYFSKISQRKHAGACRNHIIMVDKGGGQSSDSLIESPKCQIKDHTTPDSHSEEDPAVVKNLRGFDEHDMEKPKFSFPAAGPKVPFNLSDHDEKIKIPACLNQYLRDYQREGVRFLYSHFQHGRGAVLGDDMGLGKTVQVIGFLSALLGKEGNKVDLMRQKPHFIRKMLDTKELEDDVHRHPFLIISPGSVLYNWMEELDTWGYFTVRKYHGNDKATCLADISQGKAEVVVTTFETFRDNFDSLNAVAWEAVIVDEVHKIKCLKAQSTQALKDLKCLRRYGLTGTPLQNSLLELWCILDWVQPGALGSKEVFEKSVVKVIECGQKLNATKQELAEARKKKEEFAHVRCKMLLRRTKQIIADQLPRKTDRVVFCQLMPLQVDVYHAVLSHPEMSFVLHMDEACTCGSGLMQRSCCSKKTTREDSEESVQSLMLSFMHVLLKAANHAALLIPHKRAESQKSQRLEKMCKIAFQDHPEFISQTHEAAFRTLSDPKYCGKMKVLQGMLSVFMKSRSKVLIFSYSTRLLDILEQYIISKGQEYRRIDGTITGMRRQQIVHEFNKDPSIALCLVSTKAGGLGLNLTGANKVVIFDPNWNPSHDLQAQDRAYRIGQRRDVEVYRLISAGTIEENIYLRQVYKQQLDSVAVGTENARRYFLGIQGDQQNRGELFGIKNMFALRTGDLCLTHDILHRNARVEASIAGHKVADYMPPWREEKAVRGEDSDQDYSEETGEVESNSVNGESVNIFKEMFDLGSDTEDMPIASPYKGLQPVSESHNCCSKGKKVVSTCHESSEHEAGQSDGGRRTFFKQKHKLCSMGFSETKMSSKNCQASVGFNSLQEEVVSPLEKTQQKDVTMRDDCKMTNPDLQDVKRGMSGTEDQPTTPSFSSISSVFENCNVVHVHDNPHIVGSSHVEDHMSRCAMQDVFELHINKQAPALLCDPLSQQQSLESTEDQTQQSKKTLVQRKRGNPHAVGRTPARDLNSPRTLSFGSFHILIGQTPPAWRRRHWAQLRDMLNVTSDVTLAEQVLSASPQDRSSMLQNLLFKQHGNALSPVLKDIFTNASEPPVTDACIKPVGQQKANEPGQKKGQASHLITSRKRQLKKLVAGELGQHREDAESSHSPKKQAALAISNPDLQLGTAVMPVSIPQSCQLGTTLMPVSVRASGSKVTSSMPWRKHKCRSRKKTLGKRQVKVAAGEKVVEDSMSFSLEKEDMERLLDEMGVKSSSCTDSGHTGIKPRISCDKLDHTTISVDRKDQMKSLAMTASKCKASSSLLDDIFCDSDVETKNIRKPPPSKVAHANDRRKPAGRVDSDCTVTQHNKVVDTAGGTSSSGDIVFDLLNNSTLCNDLDCAGKTNLCKKKTTVRKYPLMKADKLFQETRDDFQALLDSGKLVKQINKKTVDNQKDNSAQEEERKVTNGNSASHSLFS